jgi:hypothetical protein
MWSFRLKARLLAAKMRRFAEPLGLQHKVVDIGYVSMWLLIVIQATSYDHQPAVRPDLHAKAFVRTLADTKVATVCQGRSNNLACCKVDYGS